MFIFLAALLFTTNSFGQKVPISGKVFDETGAPVIGATIVEKGTKSGTITQPDGSFILSAKANAILVVSAIGYAPQEVTANGAPLELQLHVDTKSLGEIVVTGVGVATSKKKLAFAVESVTADKLPQAPTASVDQALVGKIAGAQISSTSGVPGAPTNILLRGINTINTSGRGTSPMIMLDGIQLSATNLNSIDLHTIERVEVVQGAAAATIYGAQGANGVIQLFSKKGKPGKMQVDVSSSISRNEVLNVGGLRKARYHNFATNAAGEVIGSSGQPLSWDPDRGLYAENVIYNSLDPEGKLEKPYDQNLKYYDHFKMFFRPTTTYNTSIVVSGGSERMDYALAVSNNHQESIFRNNGYFDRSNFSANIGAELYKGLQLRSITQLIYTRNTIENQNVIYSINNARPFANYDEKMSDGNYSYYYGDAVGVNAANPNFYSQYSDAAGNKVDLVQTFNLNYRLPRFLELDMKYGINYQRNDSTFIYGDQSANLNVIDQSGWLSNYNNTNASGEREAHTVNIFFQHFTSTATFNTDFQQDFNLRLPIRTSTMVAFDWRYNKFKQYIIHGEGTPSFYPHTLADYSTRNIDADYTEPFVTFGYLVNQRIEYGDIAGVSGGFRSDYSSAFGQGSKPFTFPRGDAYLRLSSFNFWQNGSVAGIIPEFKLRAAYGEAGIQPGPFQRYAVLQPKSVGAGSVLYPAPSQRNPGLDVEVSKELEVGADLSFALLKGNWLQHAAFSLTYWKRSTNNAIYDVDAAASSGIGTIVDNAFSLESKGIQASLNIGVLASGDFSWDFTTNFSRQSSEITEVSGNPVVIISAAGSTNYVLAPGLKVGQIFGNKAIHSLDATDANGNPYIPDAEKGEYEVASNGYVVNKATKQPFFTPEKSSFGDPNPKFNMSFINFFTFKDYLSFSMQWDWVHGSHLYNQTKEWMYRDGIHSDYEKPITINGETGAWTAFYRGAYQVQGFNGTKDYFYEDASFMRLRNISLGFDFARFFHIKGIRKIQLMLTGRNLVTFTDYTGMDPEVSSGNVNSPWDRGTDHNTMPNYRSYQVGLNLGF
ncbi:TonB-dependent receptor [Chitinophaga japonensis]